MLRPRMQLRGAPSLTQEWPRDRAGEFASVQTRAQLSWELYYRLTGTEPSRADATRGKRKLLSRRAESVAVAVADGRDTVSI